MFACIYFVEDASLTVVEKNDKKLTIKTEFGQRESVSMKWGKQTYHGVIIKINNSGMVTLLKTHPGVLIKSEDLQQAVRLARKSGKPGYTLCYNLLTGVFTIEEIAISRDQGLTKPKEGDLRRPLNKDKVADVKGYALRWCKKNEKSEPKDQELNNAFTEQVSHCRKKLKKEQQDTKKMRFIKIAHCAIQDKIRFMYIYKNTLIATHGV